MVCFRYAIVNTLHMCKGVEARMKMMMMTTTTMMTIMMIMTMMMMIIITEKLNK